MVLAGVVIGMSALGYSFSVLVVFVLVLYRVYPRVRQLISARVALLGLNTSVSETHQMLEEFTRTSMRSGPRRFTGIQREIALEDVSYSYPRAQKPALSGVCARFSKGDTIAIVGRVRRGQVHADTDHLPAHRSDHRNGARRRHTAFRARPGAVTGCAWLSCRRTSTFSVRLFGTTSLTDGWTRRTKRSSRPRGVRMRTSSSAACRRDTQHPSAIVAWASPVDNGSVSRSHARCCASPISWCWTKQPMPSTCMPKRSYRKRLTSCVANARSSSSPIVLRRYSAPIAFW